MTNSIDVMTPFNHLCDFGGRLSGTISEKNALDYVSNYLSALKSGTVKTHSVEYDGWECVDSQIKINDRIYEAVPLPGCGNLPADGQDLEIVDAGRGGPDELMDLSSQIAGRAVLVTHEYMFAAVHIHRSRKFELASSLGAATFIISNPWEDSGMVSGGASPQMPAFGVSKTTAKALQAAANQKKLVHFKLDCSSKPKTTQTIDWYLSANPGQQGACDKEIIVCAHIDGHILSQSAMDNASGVAVALSLASQFANRQSRPYGIRVLIFSAEEYGLLASEKYVNSLSEIQRKSILGVLNLDCVAGSKTLCAMTSEFDYLKTIVKRSSKISGIPVSIFEPLVPNSDHFNFAAKGIPALRLIAGFGVTQSNLRHVLTSADKSNLVDREELENAFKATESMVRAMEEVGDKC